MRNKCIFYAIDFTLLALENSENQIMLKVNFEKPVNGEHHECEAIRRGDWIIFSCPKCPDYERRLNWRTGKMTSKGARADVQHSGMYFPHEFAGAFQNLN